MVVLTGGEFAITGSAAAGDKQGTSTFKDGFQCMEGFS
jgi:hypothetical protein